MPWGKSWKANPTTPEPPAVKVGLTAGSGGLVPGEPQEGWKVSAGQGGQGRRKQAVMKNGLIHAWGASTISAAVLCQSAGAAPTKYYRPQGSHSTDVFPPRSGSWRSKIGASAGLVSHKHWLGGDDFQQGGKFSGVESKYNED